MVKAIRSHADRIFMMPDPETLVVALAVAGVGAISILRVLTGLIEQETRLHDTKVKVAQLQIGYLERARGMRGAMVVGEEEAMGVGEEAEAGGGV